MPDSFTVFLNALLTSSYWEYTAVLLGFMYVVLAVRESLWCWYAGFVSSIMYAAMYWHGNILVEAILNLYYMLMAVIGWWVWRQGTNNSPLPIISWPVRIHLFIIILTSLFAISLSTLIQELSNDISLSYIESFTLCFAVVITYLVVRKVLENWLYWIVINMAPMYLYFMKGYYPTLALALLLTLISCVGYKRWYERYELKQGKTLAEL
ncbi:nicotinamide mononucleotide transporter [Pseudoalteromonas sp. JBTF-M23]|uniref:Nicotinamide riboside transporter PnuC n=1 Tax=Pseudoalteromonas caenipelagi TaxID=2726988 RepID=A0A849VF24_9GAMM|nr:nicotinamide riboside transporter PnuC [Pseudoalteromonas caenipelagi]NOU51992.1 nicotinamide mononucleotide transporter [Pseudoalteromonas caenipelagi]